MTSPTFVAVFDDHKRTTTRMTTWHGDGRRTLDLPRGVRLARAAYKTRTKSEPPAIVKAHYERDGAILQEYDADEVKAVTRTPWEPAP
jgi:hypothetical protein